MPPPDNRISLLPTGFAGSYDDYVDQPLNLHELLVMHPAATFFFRVVGADLEPSGIYDGDIAVVDRALSAHHLDYVLCVVNRQFVVQEWRATESKVHRCEDGAGTNNENEVIGVITSLVRQLRRG